MPHPAPLRRREFLQTALAAGVALTAGTSSLALGQQPVAKKNIKLGLDNFAVRAMQWKAEALIDYAAEQKLDSLFISDLDALESFDEAYLARVRSKAEDRDLQLHLGTWSICPTSTRFRDTWGSAEEHLALGLRVAAALGSPVLRVILGSREDRLTEGGIQARIADTVAVCKAARKQSLELGVKIAVENHAGDMHSRELVQLIEQAGPDFVGANMDSGNAVWALEHPLDNLERLAPFALTTSLRDSAVWTSDNGFTVQWTAMGDGDIDLKAYFNRFAELCPQTTVHIETISGFNHEMRIFDREFWKTWPKARAADVAPLLEVARRGKARPTFQPPEGDARQQAEQEYQRRDFERSIQYCREQLGLGVKA